MLSLEYIAGFIDGEGCIYTHALRNGRKTPCGSIEIVNTDRRTLELIQTSLGVGALRERSGGRLGKKAQWKLVIEGNHRVRGVLTRLIPHLIQKRDRAGFVLNAITNTEDL